MKYYIKRQIESTFLKYRRLIIIFFHLILISAAYILAFLIRYDLKLDQNVSSLILQTIPLLLIVKVSVFYYYGLFSGLWRYVSIDDFWQIIKANSVATILFILGNIFIYGSYNLLRSVIVMDFIVCTGLISSVRFFTRLLKERYKHSFLQKQKKVLIIGAGQAGILTLKECYNNPSMGQVIGFIDDDPLKQKERIYGKRVLGDRHHIADVVSKFNVEEIILAIPSSSGKVIREIISYCQIPNAKLKIVPGLQKIIDGDLEVKSRDVKPEDLLGRETVKINEAEINSYIKNKCVLVTGAGGSIGSALCRQIIHFNPKLLILLDYNENNIYFLQVEFRTKYPNAEIKTFIGDIKDVGLLKYIFSTYRPQVVFHAAAHKHLSLMEENPTAAVKNNIIGSRNIMYAANHYKAERFVLISTDKAVNPSSIMGATKRISEMVLQAKAKTAKTKFMAVRFGNVLGSNGSVVPLFKKQIEEGGPITVTHPDVKRYFMSVNEAAQLVLQAGAIGIGGEIFILDMGEQIKIVDLARNLIMLSGLKPDDIPIKFIGLRPGEKLAEEMFFDIEKGLTTKHNRIHIVQPNDFDPHRLRSQVRELEQLANDLQDSKIVKKICELVPSCSDGHNLNRLNRNNI